MTRMILAGAAAAGLAAILTGWFAPSGVDDATAASAPSPVQTVAEATSTPAAASVSADKAFAAECGACHMAFPPGLLPARSWEAIMAGLADHFGEDASLDPDTARQIGDYLAAHAADAGGHSPRVLRGLAANDVPLRITDIPWWKRAHGEVSAASFERPDIKSRSNCIGCHGPAAARGVFEDD